MVCVRFLLLLKYKAVHELSLHLVIAFIAFPLYRQPVCYHFLLIFIGQLPASCLTKAFGTNGELS